MKIAIVGCRYSSPYILLKSVLNNLDPSLNKYPLDPMITYIISGGATGIDVLAYKYAMEKGITFTAFPPSREDKIQYGYAKACKRRNLKIVLSAEILVAFPSSRSKGTWHTIGLAKKFNVPTKIIKLP